MLSQQSAATAARRPVLRYLDYIKRFGVSETESTAWQIIVYTSYQPYSSSFICCTEADRCKECLGKVTLHSSCAQQQKRRMTMRPNAWTKQQHSYRYSFTYHFDDNDDNGGSKRCIVISGTCKLIVNSLGLHTQSLSFSRLSRSQSLSKVCGRQLQK